MKQNIIKFSVATIMFAAIMAFSTKITTSQIIGKWNLVYTIITRTDPDVYFGRDSIAFDSGSYLQFNSNGTYYVNALTNKGKSIGGSYTLTANQIIMQDTSANKDTLNVIIATTNVLQLKQNKIENNKQKETWTYLTK